jgi:DNA-directed RNA polymerase subunit F
MPKDLPSPEELREQFQMLRRFLELPPERLARIRESIERIEQMPEARKKTMLSLINQNQPERSRPVSPLAEVPEAIRPRFEEIWRQLTPEGRSALAERMRPMSREQRQAFLEGVVALSELSGPRLPWAAPDMWNVESEK